MPLDPSIALQTQSVNPTNLISGFLDLGLKRNALERGNATLLSDIAQRQAESRSSQANATVNEANVNPLIRQQAASTQQSETQAQSSQFHLQGEKAQLGRQIAGGFLQDPDFIDGNSEGMITKLIGGRQALINAGLTPTEAEANTAQLISLAVSNPKGVRQALGNIVQQGIGSGGQAAQNFVPASQQIQPGPSTPQGNPTAYQRSALGGQVTQAALPQAGQPPQQQAAPLQFPPGENPDTYKQLVSEREAGRSTVTQAPTIHALNREILDELSKATTGQYAGIIAKGQSLAGMLGLSLTGNNEQERAASAYDLVDKYTTQAATRAAQSMGNDTATALNAQLKQNASVERNPTAIRKSIKFNDAVLSGAEAYQGGLEKAIAANPQADVFIKRKFDQEWAKAFDPVILQIYQAKRSGDAGELADLLKSVGKRGPEIQAKAQRLQQLMNGL